MRFDMTVARRASFFAAALGFCLMPVGAVFADGKSDSSRHDHLPAGRGL